MVTSNPIWSRCIESASLFVNCLVDFKSTAVNKTIPVGWVSFLALILGHHYIKHRQARHWVLHEVISPRHLPARLKLNGTVKIPGKVFENLGIRFECTLFDGLSGIIEKFVFHSQEVSGFVSLPSAGDRTIRFPVYHTPKKKQHLFFRQNCGPPRWIASWIPSSVLGFLCQ